MANDIAPHHLNGPYSHLTVVLIKNGNDVVGVDITATTTASVFVPVMVIQEVRS